MLNNLPVQYRRDPWLIVLAAALQVPMDRQGGVIRSLPSQISLDRVTWNLPVEERVAGIVPPAVATVEQRPAARQERGFVLVWPAKGETRWQTAKRLRVAEEELHPAGKGAVLAFRR